MKKIIFLLLFVFVAVAGYSQTDSVQINSKDRVTMPNFPGGIDGLISFLSSNIKYPQDAIKNKISGKVLIQFILSPTGKVEEVTVLESLSPSCDAEAVRVVKSMPDWTPAEYKGKKIKIIQSIPISFKQ